jgi:light-regulated signal transduction histidine kinase (bacteriophytochrome)
MDPGVLSAFFESSPVAFAIIAEDSRSIRMNKAYATLMQKKDVQQPISTGEEDRLHAACQAVLKDGVTRVISTKSQTGGAGCLEAEIFSLWDANHRAVGVILRQADLPTDQSGKALRARTRQVNELQREMEDFSYSVSHDLRAPVRAVIGFSQALQQELGTSVQSNPAEYLTRVRESGERISELMDHLLRFSRAARREPVKTAVNVTDAGHAVAKETAKMDPERTVSWLIQADMRAQTDDKYLRETLGILFHNALKFTRDNREAAIEFGSRVENDETHFYVKDNGVGYDLSYAEKLFSPFQRLHAPDEFEGEGMGLAIARRIIGRMGGRIWAESTPGKGATFFFTLGD